MATPVLEPVRRWWRFSEAPEGIFGTIVCASVIAASEDDTPVHVVAWAVVVTLVIYWLAERWSELFASRLRGQPLTAHHVLMSLLAGWPIVSAMYPPLAVMLAFRAFGAHDETAENLGLATCVLTLAVLGTVAGRRVGLGRAMAAVSGLGTGLLGVALIVLKAILH